MTRIAIVSRNPAEDLNTGRLSRIAAALAERDLEPTLCVYDEAREATFEAELLDSQAALVWVNPVQDGRRRNGLDDILRRMAASGLLVSAHPEVIDILGVKSVLARTRDLGWSGDAHHYVEPTQLSAEFPDRLATGPRVLKPNRGNDGRGVWKVVDVGGGRVRLAEAYSRAETVLDLTEFIERRLAEFTACDGFVDQAFQDRLSDGMIRCYLSADRVVGFGWQKVRALLDDSPSPPRTYSGASDSRFQGLKAKVERDWTPGLLRLLGLTPEALPVIWDADFFFGPKDADGADTFVLCEINVCSVSPMPDNAATEIAATLSGRLERSR